MICQNNTKSYDLVLVINEVDINVISSIWEDVLVCLTRSPKGFACLS
jgi:hypothetical protein